MSKQIFSPNEKLKGPSIVLIYQDWCGYCVSFKPTFEKMAQLKKDISFIKYDYSLGTPKFTKIPITTVPHLLFKNGSKEMKYEGVRNMEDIVNSFHRFSTI